MNNGDPLSQAVDTDKASTSKTTEVNQPLTIHGLHSVSYMIFVHRLLPYVQVASVHKHKLGMLQDNKVTTKKNKSQTQMSNADTQSQAVDTDKASNSKTAEVNQPLTIHDLHSVSYMIDVHRLLPYV